MSRRGGKKSRQKQEAAAPARVSAWARIPFFQAAQVGFVAILVATWLQPTENAWLDGSTAVHCLMWLIVLATALAGIAIRSTVPIPLARDRYGRIPFPKWNLVDSIVLTLTLWIGIASIGVLIFGETNARQLFNASWQWPAMASVYFGARVLFQTSLLRQHLTILLIGSTLFLTGTGLYQFFYDLPNTRAAYEDATEEEKQSILRGVGVPQVEPGSRMRVLYENRLRSLEPMATFGLANSLACVLSAWLCVACSVVIANFAYFRNERLTLIAWCVSILAVAFCLLLTKSRTAYLATFAGIMLIGFFYGRSWLLSKRGLMSLSAALLVVVIMVSVGIAVGTLDVQIVTEAFKSFRYRIEYWQATSSMIAQEPIVGYGPGNFQDGYTEFKLPQSSESVSDPHNFLLELGATSGLPAMLLAIGIVFVVVRFALAKQGDVAPTESTVQSQSRRPIIQTICIGLVLALLLAAILMPLAGYALPVGLLIFGTLASAPFFVIAFRRLPPISDSISAQVGLLVLAINLLAAGGISYLGVSSHLFVLLAMSVSSFPAQKSVLLTPLSRRLGPGLTQAAAIVAIGLVIGCVIVLQQTTVLPVMKSKTLLGDARIYLEQGRFEAARQSALDATFVDPWNGEAWRIAAYVRFQEWLVSGDSSGLAEMDEFLEQVQLRKPRSSQMYREIGGWYLVIYERETKLEYLTKAIDAFSHSAERYPNEAWIQAQLAWCFHLADEDQLAADKAQEALRLDKLCPHDDLRLKNRTLHALTEDVASESTEQIMESLRISN